MELGGVVASKWYMMSHSERSSTDVCHETHQARSEPKDEDRKEADLSLRLGNVFFLVAKHIPYGISYSIVSREESR